MKAKFHYVAYEVVNGMLFDLIDNPSIIKLKLTDGLESKLKIGANIEKKEYRKCKEKFET